MPVQISDLKYKKPATEWTETVSSSVALTIEVGKCNSPKI